MKRSIATCSAILSVVILSAAAHAQMGFRPPEMRGVWNPVVGAGSVYHVERKGEQKSDMEIAVVGKETVEGKPGYWLEMSVADSRTGQPAYVKHLMVRENDRTEVKGMIMQTPGRPPIEMPVAMGQKSEQTADVRKEAERVGTENVTTPAGTFACEHYRMKDGSADVWVTDKVAPWGLVKMTGRDTNMTLVRELTDATTHITGTPQRLDPAEMMRRPRGRE